MTTIREPAVAGRFYPSDSCELERLMDSFDRAVSARPELIDAKGLIAPHAGYTYSGALASALFRSIEFKSRIILLGPRHHSHGAAGAWLSRSSRWRSPLGDIPIDTETVDEILTRLDFADVDEEAHENEHSIEVELPFIQRYARGSVSITPMVLGAMGYARLSALGVTIGRIARRDRSSFLIVASSDFSHGLPLALAEKLDRSAIDPILDFDPARFFEIVRSGAFSICGVEPIVATLIASRELGAHRAELIDYRTSADVTREETSVVGYASIAFS